MTEDEIWEEINRAIQRPAKFQTGDITPTRYSKHFHISIPEAKRQMEEIARAKPERFAFLAVTAGNGKPVQILRALV